MITVLIDWWHDNALVFLAGSLCWSVCGCLLLAFVEAPLPRQRAAELTIVAWAIWLLLALVPGAAAPGIETAPLLHVDADALGVTDLALPGALLSSAVVQPAIDVVAILDWIGLVLAAGMLLASASLFGAWLWLQRSLRGASPAPDAVLELLSRLAPVGRARMRVVVSARTWRPFCCGIVRTFIVLPKVMLDLDSSARDAALRAVLLHELAHIERGDLRGRWLFALAMPLSFWNPLFWRLRQSAHAAAELLADELAASRSKGRAGYARSLIDLAEWLPAAREGRAVALGVFGSQTHFSQRMTMLLRRTSPLALRSPRLHSVIRGTFALALAALASLAWTAPKLLAQDPVKVAAPTAETPAAPLAETAEKTPRELLIYAMDVSYQKVEQIGVLVTKLARRGFAIQGLDIAPEGGDTHSAKIVFRVRGASQVKEVQKLSEPTVTVVSLHQVKVESEPAKKESSDSPRVYFAFDDTDVQNVIDAIAKIAGVNIVIGKDVQGKVTIRLRNVPWQDALEATVRQVGATLREEKLAAGKGSIYFVETKSTEKR